MRPLSSLYDRLLEARARRYADGRLPSERLPLPTLSVGNITVGGTGKTPFVLHLAEKFLSQGRRPAILSRGYGRRSTAVVVVSTGDGPLVAPDEGGDEPVLLASRLPGAVVVVAPRRSDAARAALESSPDLFLLDDGFQHLAVDRDLDLVLLDARDPFGGGRYPPFGRLREPPSALARANAVVFTRAGSGHPSAEVRRDVARRNPASPQFTALIRPDRLVAADGSTASSSPARPLAVSGIARPEDFRRTLDAMGIVPAESLAFEDHRRYGSPDVDRIARTAAASGADAIVTTEKDLVKLAGRLPLPTYAVRLAVEVEEPGFASFVSERLFGRHLGARR
jgi:tetraacyldisaccharide 4'-kinase